jgi:hypothetical protein
MRTRYRPRLGLQALGLLCVAALVVAEAQDATPSLRAPLALMTFLVVPGLGLVSALRVRADASFTAAVALGLSLTVDLLGTEVLLLARAATVRNLLLTIGAVSLLCLLASAASAPRLRMARS